MKRNTLDLDFNDKDRIADIYAKVGVCPDRSILVASPSASLNGWHFRIVCKKDCDLCRLVFDDAERYSRDLRRPLRTRDVLWNKKVYRKAGQQITLEC